MHADFTQLMTWEILDSKSRVYSPRFHPVDDRENIGFKKSSLSRVYAPRFYPFDYWENIELKKSSLSQVYAPRFHPVDKWISTVEFKSS